MTTATVQFMQRQLRAEAAVEPEAPATGPVESRCFTIA